MATATVTLSTTTLSRSVSVDDRDILLASLSGILPGMRLWVDRELMAVVDTTLPGGWSRVRRGVDGTASQAHSSSATVYIGRADQFYQDDPVGTPPAEVPVSPRINVITGDHWLAQGDEVGPGRDARYWQKVETTRSIGALGVRVSESSPS